MNNLKSIFTVHKSKPLWELLGGSKSYLPLPFVSFFSYSQNILKEEEGKFFHFLSKSFSSFLGIHLSAFTTTIWYFYYAQQLQALRKY